MDEAEKGDLTTEAERLSYDWVKKHYNHEFLFVTDYSAEKRAFLPYAGRKWCARATT